MSGGGPEGTAFVLDASALLCYLRREEGGEVVQRVLRQCSDCATRAALPASDLLAVYAVVARECPDRLDDLISLMAQLPLEVTPVTAETVEASVRLLATSDCPKPELASALEVSTRTRATLVTCDQEAARLPGCLYVGPPRNGAGVGKEMSKS